MRGGLCNGLRTYHGVVRHPRCFRAAAVRGGERLQPRGLGVRPVIARHLPCHGFDLVCCQILLVAADGILLCAAGVVKRHRLCDGELVGPVDGVGGDFVDQCLALHPLVACYGCRQRMFRVFAVDKYNRERCALLKCLRDHHKGLRLGGDVLALGCVGYFFVQFLREGGGFRVDLPRIGFHLVCPLVTNAAEGNALYRAFLHG